jgi:hypothetical protein
MANQVTLTFAGDADQLAKASKKASDSVEQVGDDVKKVSSDFDGATQGSAGFTDKIGKLGAGVDGLSTAFDDVGGTLQGFIDLQNQGFERSQKMKRALVDVQQAQEDYNQAVRDGKQAAIDSDQAEVDLEQARLDQTTALRDYNQAVKEHGKNSAEARQAQIDLKQAGVDVKQAQEDSAQAIRDANQATIDAKSATIDLADAQKEANPPDIQKWADQVGAYTPLLQGLVGVVGLVTAAQWAWNAAQTANPIGLIIVAVGALVAVIVLIATKTTWFQDLWRVTWGWIKQTASNVAIFFKEVIWGKWIKGAWDAIMNKALQFYVWMRDLPAKLRAGLSGIGNAILSPFRWAFNKISEAWNNTIGRLQWTVPSWIPGVGGNTVAAPHLPKFHAGGVVPGVVGSETLAVLQAGEKISSPASSGGSAETIYVRGDLGDMLIEILARAIGRRGGNAQYVLGGKNA